MKKWEMKVVGNRKWRDSDYEESARILLKTIRSLRGGKGICPKGVYRFKTFKEANEWIIKILAKSIHASR